MSDSSTETLTEEDSQELLVMIHPRAKEGKVDAAIAALEMITAPSRANPDCLELRVFQDNDNPRNFTLIERWVSMDAVVAHGKRDYMSEYNATKDDIFESLEGDFLREIDPVETAK
jgi:quinol monooxygenase YgiN